MSGERGDLYTCDISSESPRFTVNTVTKFKVTPPSVYRSKATLRADVGRPLIVRGDDQGSSRTLGKEKMKRANGDSCFKQCSFKGSVKASRSSSLIQQLWGRDDLELRLRMIFHTLFQRAGLWSPDCSGWSVPAVFCTIWCQRWWLEEMSSPKWNSLWNSISCVSQCAMGTSSSVVYSKTDIVRVFHPDSAALSLRPRMERRWPGV